MTTEIPKVVGPEYLIPLTHRTLATIKVDARARPETLPPQLKIPGSARLLWLRCHSIRLFSGTLRPVTSVIGFDSLLEFAAKSRHRKVCGFVIGTSYGGADGRAQALPVFAPRVPRSVNPSALPPDLTVGGRVLTELWRPSWQTQSHLLAALLPHSFSNPPHLKSLAKLVSNG